MYDAIIVGTRVAGAATALLLARRGLRVLAVDRAEFPSDTLSTHQIQPPGVARLARWGLLDDLLRAGTPPTYTVRFDQPGTVLKGSMPTCGDVNFLISPRRTVLDKILVDAAQKAGAELRQNYVVESLLFDDGKVAGVRGGDKGGPLSSQRATFVIGADGKHSTVAKAVGAQAYRQRPARSMAFYTYWSGVPVDGGEIYGRPGQAVGLWPTNDGLVMSYLAWPIARFDEFRADVEGNFMRAMDEIGLGERLRAGQRAERFRGTTDLPNLFRKPSGPGWALVGDAGLVMDPITGQGISDALRDAELLTDAITSGSLAGYQKRRDRAVKSMYDFTVTLAALAPPRQAELDLFAAVARSQADTDLFISVLTGAVPMAQAFTPAKLVRLLGWRGFARLAFRIGG